MERVDGESGLGDVEFGRLLVEDLVVVLHQVHEVAAGHVFHDHVQVLRVLERVEQLHQPTSTSKSTSMTQYCERLEATAIHNRAISRLALARHNVMYRCCVRLEYAAYVFGYVE